MPKKVDQTQRKNHIAAAAWRVILENGIDKASFQQIADEAGISVGLIQHNFASKDQLIHYAMKLVLDRMEERAQTRQDAFTGTKEEAVRRLMKFIVPTNPEELMEAKVWITFLGIAYSNPELHELMLKMDAYTRHLMGMVLNLMEELGYLPPDSDRNIELEILYAFIDGLVLHVLQTPERYPEETVDQMIDYYLTSKKRSMPHE